MRLLLNPADHVRLLRRLPPPGDAAPSRRSIRLDACLSMRNVADALGVTAQTVRLWEIGQRNVSAEFLEPYVELLEALAKVTAA